MVESLLLLLVAEKDLKIIRGLLVKKIINAVKNLKRSLKKIKEISIVFYLGS